MENTILKFPSYGVMGEASPNDGINHETLGKMMSSAASIQIQLDLEGYARKTNWWVCLDVRKFCF